MFKKILLVPILLLVALAAFANNDSEYLQPTASHLKEARLIVQILDYYHYRDVSLNDSLSSVIFDNYINSLDGNKTSFLESDIKSFEKYRYNLDDALKRGDLVPAFYIFNIYKKRLDNRLKYALERSQEPFDFTKDEVFYFDREKADYAQTEAELDEIWRKTIKNQALSLKLNEKDDAELKELMTKRYERFYNNVSKYNSNDVFEIFMNSVTEGFDPHTNYFTPLNAEDFRCKVRSLWRV